MSRYVATSAGFINGLRIRPGQEFELPANLKPGKWMQPVDSEAARKAVAEKTKNAKKSDPVALSELSKNNVIGTAGVV